MGASWLMVIADGVRYQPYNAFGYGSLAEGRWAGKGPALSTTDFQLALRLEYLFNTVISFPAALGGVAPLLRISLLSHR